MQHPITNSLSSPAVAALAVPPEPKPTSLKLIHSSHVLGPGHQVVIRAQDANDVFKNSVGIGMGDHVRPLLVSSVLASSMMVRVLKARSNVQPRSDIQELSDEQ